MNEVSVLERVSEGGRTYLEEADGRVPHFHLAISSHDLDSKNSFREGEEPVEHVGESEVGTQLFFL